MAREISSSPGLHSTIPFRLLFLFPFPYLSSVSFPFRFPFPFLVPFPLQVPFSLPCGSSSPSPLSLSLPLLGQLLPPLGAPGSTHFSSSSSSSITLYQFSGLTAGKSPGLCCQQLGGSIIALRLLLLYQEKRSPVHFTFPERVVCGLECLTWSPNAWGLCHLEMFIWLRFLSIIYPIYQRKAAQHSRKGELLLLRCCHLSLNFGKWRFVTGSRKIVTWKRSHVLSSLMPETFYIHMSPLMGSEMNLFIWAQSNDWRQFITDVGIFPLTVAFPFLFGCPLVPSLWVENESTSKALALWYSCMYRKQAQREHAKWCRSSGVL